MPPDLNDRKLRLQSAIALYGIFNEDTYLNVIKEALEREDYTTRHKILFTLSDICNKNNRGMIIPLLEKYLGDQDPKIRKSAEEAIKYLRLKDRLLGRQTGGD